MSLTVGLDWPLVGRGVELDRVVAALADPQVRVVHLVGAPGTGKSRLAEESLLAAEADGYPVARVVASDGSSGVPLSVLAPLLPPGVPAGPQAVEAVVAHVRDLADGSRVVVHADDVDALDVVSCDVLARLWREQVVVVVATQRAGTTTPAVLLAEHRRGGVLRLDVGDLPRRSAGTLLHHALRGPVAGEAEHALWTASAGNPLYLRELVTGAVLADRLVRVDGLWLLDGALDVPGSLAELVAQRIGDLQGAAREVADLLALCAPLGVDGLAERCPLEVLEQLEESGVVTVVPDGRRQQVALSHPLHAEVLRARMPRLRMRRLLLDEVARTEEHGERRRDDRLRVAAWRLDATGTADADGLVAAAELARSLHHYPQVERLARAALVLEPDAAASVLLAEALHEQGRSHEADDVLARALDAVGDVRSPAGVRLAVMRSLVLHSGLGRGEDALALLDAVGPVEGEPGAAVAAMRALLLTQAGRSADALAALPAAPPDDVDIRAVHERARAWALYRTGRTAEAACAALAAWESRADIAAGLLHPAGDLVIAALAELENGRPDAARALAARGRDRAIADGLPVQAGWLAWAVAVVDLVMGFAEDASTAFRELAVTAAQGGYPSLQWLASMGLTECAAMLGDVERARDWLERGEALPPAAPAFAAAGTMARAWAAAASGDARRAAALVRAHGHDLAARGELREAVALLDEAVLFGDTDAAADLLALVDAVDTPVTRARALRARAAVSGEPDDLLAAADAFASCDFVHSAATLAVEAARVLRARGDARAAAAAQARAAAEAARSPGLRVEGLEASPSTSLLTPREREIAALAAAGRSSKEIAADLVLSVRTVDNHLANVYAKLGVRGRSELAGALGLVRAEVPSPRQGEQS